jgi:sialate O-acetylesterase
MKMKTTSLFIGVVCCATLSIADVRLGSLFSDGMVIQRETPAPVWGWAEPGETVSVTASWGAKATVTTGADGTWSVKLATPKAGTGLSMVVKGENTITIQDVASGEVWLCGGQSNMDHPLNALINDAREPNYQPNVEYNRNEVQTANDPLLRHIAVSRNRSPYERVSEFEGSWKPVAPGNTGEMTATGYYFGRELRRNLGDVPVGLVECAVGGTKIQPWISKEAYLAAGQDKEQYYQNSMFKLQKAVDTWNSEVAAEQYKQALAEWKEKGSKGNKPKAKQDPASDITLPTTLYNGMVATVVPYAIKGVIWYQGESNAGPGESVQYGGFFDLLINSWRKEWGQGDFSFYWVQLTAYKDPDVEPLERDSWSTICDHQRRALTLPNTGMAVTYDIGEAKDIHPHNKADVGARLAFWALAKDYGVKLPAYSGPLYKEHEIKGGNVFIRFDEVGSGLMVGQKHLMDPVVPADGPLKRFQICGADLNWKWADAKIVSKDTIQVSHPDVPHPTIVCYAWSMNPEGANLYNKEGLPASRFTTE